MLPVKWRSEGASSAFVLILWPVGKDQHLLALTPDRWTELYDKLRRQSLSNSSVTAAIRQLGLSVERVALDRVGRLPLPDHLTKPAGIGGEVELFGLLDRFELWSPERYAAQEEDNKRIAAEVFEKIEL